MKIKEILSTGQIGSEYDLTVAITGAQERTAKNGNTYYTVDYTDGEKTITSPWFDPTTMPNPPFKANIKVLLSEFKSNRNLRIQQLIHVSDDISEFVNTGVDREQLVFDVLDRAAGLATEAKDPILANWCQSMKDHVIMKVFLVCPAAKNVHHNYKGGLAQHSVEVAQTAATLLENSEVKPSPLSLAVTLIGGLFHDIGKITCYSYDSNVLQIEYTDSADLLGHEGVGLSLMAKLFEGHLVLPLIRKRIAHIIASHSGLTDWGALKPPATPEAFAVFAADYTSCYKALCDSAPEAGMSFHGRTLYPAL